MLWQHDVLDGRTLIRTTPPPTLPGHERSEQDHGDHERARDEADQGPKCMESDAMCVRQDGYRS